MKDKEGRDKKREEENTVKENAKRSPQGVAKKPVIKHGFGGPTTNSKIKRSRAVDLRPGRAFPNPQKTFFKEKQREKGTL